MRTEQQIELLAEYAHTAWSGWMKYLFSKCIEDYVSEYSSINTGALIIPKEFVNRWKRQMDTSYEKLPENEKESDRKEAIEILNILSKEEENNGRC